MSTPAVPVNPGPDENRPNPDPSVMTTQSMWREIANLRELFEARLDGVIKILDRLERDVAGIPALRHEAVENLRMLVEEKFIGLEEKFNGIATQFSERDKRTEHLSVADKTAIAAALQAQKEAAGATNESNTAAIAKSEGGFTKQIDQIGALIATTFKGQDEKVGDIKERLTLVESMTKNMGDVDDLRSRITTIEGRTNGMTTQKQETSQNWSSVFGAVGMGVGLLGAVGVIVALASGG